MARGRNGTIPHGCITANGSMHRLRLHNKRVPSAFTAAPWVFEWESGPRPAGMLYTMPVWEVSVCGLGGMRTTRPALRLQTSFREDMHGCMDGHTSTRHPSITGLRQQHCFAGNPKRTIPIASGGSRGTCHQPAPRTHVASSFVQSLPATPVIAWGVHTGTYARMPKSAINLANGSTIKHWPEAATMPSHTHARTHGHTCLQWVPLACHACTCVCAGTDSWMLFARLHGYARA